jgi:5'-3' exonuclease
MILVDLNQVLLSGLMAQMSSQKGMKLEEDLVRHMVLNILRNNIKAFRKDYGDVVLCCDNRKYWRKEIFPFYKAGRKKAREKSDLDWHLIFDILGIIKQELKENFPYKVIDVEGAEADDIIGTLVPRHAMSENILILSSDGDFLQLQQYGFNSNFKVSQFNPALKKYVISENPLMDLKEKIIRGDKGDGIPNIFSPSDCFVRELRQKAISKGKLEELMKENYDQWPDDTAKAGYIRNQMLIDLRHIPSEIKDNIINTFDELKPASKQKMLNYFIDKRLKNLMEVIEEF